ncbi:MAG: type II toxin-antitoxin system RelE/ParE family toxin [candidate division NC10 bacterium]|nr:type II toxin-antitoxin system RelE/ParE family toxin [candidate division NC10 bacterium]
MRYEVEVRPEVVAEDLAELPANIRARIIRAIESRLMTEPTRYGIRLRQSLGGLWKIRVGDYRIVYEIEGEKVTVWAIRHRKDVYEEAELRWLSA